MESYLSAVVNLPKIYNEDAKRLREIYDTVAATVNSLTAFAPEVKYWDKVIIYLMITKFGGWQRFETVKIEDTDLNTLKDFTSRRALNIISDTSKSIPHNRYLNAGIQK